MTARTPHRFAAAIVALVLVVLPAFAQHDHPHDHDHDHAHPQQNRAPAIADTIPSVDPPDTPAGRRLDWLLKTLRGAEFDTAGRFHPDFLAHVEEERLQAVLKGLAGASEGYILIRVDEENPHSLVGVARARSDGSAWRIILTTEADEPHRINALFFQPAPHELLGPLHNWEVADKALHNLEAGAVSLHVARVRDDHSLETIHAHDPDRPLAIGSAFKLWILGALAREVEHARAAWDEPLPIIEEYKSLPSGVMQDLRDGDTAPIAEYALKMISISDNTATDHLLLRVGRNNVHAWMAERTADPKPNTPLLATREFFTIKLSMDETLLDRYADADTIQRIRILNEEVALNRPSPLLIQAWLMPQRIDKVEWFATTHELARVIAELRAISKQHNMAPVADALTTNRGVPFDEAHWKRVWFKGGSEPGVLNLTWLMERADGEVFTLVMTANDTERPINEAATVGLAQRIIEYMQTID